MQKSFGDSSCEESTGGLVPLKYPRCGEAKLLCRWISPDEGIPRSFRKSC
jgi:hypothetical protein